MPNKVSLNLNLSEEVQERQRCVWCWRESTPNISTWHPDNLTAQCVIQQTRGQASSGQRQACEVRWVTVKRVNHYKELLVRLATLRSALLSLPPPFFRSFPSFKDSDMEEFGLRRQLCLRSYWTSCIVSSGLYNSTCVIDEFEECLNECLMHQQHGKTH